MSPHPANFLNFLWRQRSFHHVAQAGLKLLGSKEPHTPASQNTRITGVSQHTGRKVYKIVKYVILNVWPPEPLHLASALSFLLPPFLLSFTILLLQPPKQLYYRHALPCPANFCIFSSDGVSPCWPVSLDLLTSNKPLALAWDYRRELPLPAK